MVYFAVVDCNIVRNSVLPYLLE